MGTLGSGMKPNDLIKILQSKERDKARAANQKARKFRTQGIFWAAVILIPMAIISPGWRQDVADLLDRPLPVRYGFDDEGDGGVGIFEVDDQIDWVAIPAGIVNLNWTARVGKTERFITLPAFEISRSEVTVAQYERCIEEGPCTYPERTEDCNFGRDGYDRHPVNCVTRAQARLFGRWVRGRLPSEAEWEYVALSLGKTRGYPWGEETPTCRHATLNLGGEGCGAGSAQPACVSYLGYSQQGVCDLAGNVWEWMADDFLRDPDRVPLDGTPYSTDKEVKGVRRGGGWTSTIPDLSPQRRSSIHPETASPELGFRVVRRAPPIVVSNPDAGQRADAGAPDMTPPDDPATSIDASLFDDDAGAPP